MAVPLKYSGIYGGLPSNGDASAEASFDSVIFIGGPASSAYAVTHVKAMYGVAGLDYDKGGANAIRSFSGRLTIARGHLTQSLSGGFPNTQLTARFPSNLDVIFDQLINTFGEPLQFEFPFAQGSNAPQPGPGAIISDARGLSIILTAGSGYTDPGGLVDYFTVQHLHVCAFPLSNDLRVKIGAYTFE